MRERKRQRRRDRDDRREKEITNTLGVMESICTSIVIAQTIETKREREEQKLVKGERNRQEGVWVWGLTRKGTACGRVKARRE